MGIVAQMVIEHCTFVLALYSNLRCLTHACLRYPERLQPGPATGPGLLISTHLPLGALSPLFEVNTTEFPTKFTDICTQALVKQVLGAKMNLSRHLG
jgi:hypothetical protein